MTFSERKAQRSKAFKAKQGLKTGNREEIAAVKKFYQVETAEAQEKAEEEKFKAEFDSAKNRYLYNDC